MTIQEVKQEIPAATKPIVKVLRKTDSTKIIVLGFNKGVILKEHETNVPAKLVVIDGQVQYREGDKLVTLNQYDELEIPVNILHSVEGIQQSICLLIHG
jgi:quercetin dioxygenase-like cupin family protein